ncbi:MAG: tRNA pseudouridine(55) synthase TruB [Burkholderiales bacterium]|nr:tRNA pseudouridine(55) synthase TruB [Burkholderiales bacterium]
MARSVRSRASGRREVHGVLLLDKALGMSSNQAVQAVKRLYAAPRAGHTGTLDPLATGLLVIALGEATKFAGGLLAADKSYAATIRLGITTATGDAEGEVLGTHPPQSSRAEVERALRAFVGEIEQVPPMHSALKKGGRPLYAYARAGETVERQPRRVTVYALELEAFDGRDLRVHARVGKGTYLRTLAEDIGRHLGCGAHLGALRRTGVGRFRVEAALTLDALERIEPPGRARLLHPVDAMLAGLPEVALDAEGARRFRHGQAVALAAGDAPDAPAADLVRVYGPERVFLGRGARDGRTVRPERVVVPLERSAPCGTS